MVSRQECSSARTVTSLSWGDYDGDGRVDLSVFRGGVWYRLDSSNGAFSADTFGIDTDMPVPADYDGDDRDDVAVFRPSDGTGTSISAMANTADPLGSSGDVPVPGDYDGDNWNDIAVYREGIWYINGSGGSIAGLSVRPGTDIPIPKKYIP